jgi:prolyl 4-hydroxylase
MINEIPNFLSEGECDVIMDIINHDCKFYKSRVTNYNKVGGSVNDFRTSSTCVLDKKDMFVLDINERICELLGVDILQGEALQGQLYEKGQYFKPHHDWFGTETLQTHGMVSGNRTHTLMIYLNDDMEGGETDFPKLNKKIKPQKGKAIWWKNIDENGKGIDEVFHEGCPIINGKKYIITAWFRQNVFDPPADEKAYAAKIALDKQESNRCTLTPTEVVSTELLLVSDSQLPICTDMGFEVVKCPEDVWEVVQTAYKAVQGLRHEEKYHGKENTILGEGVTSEMFPIFEKPDSPVELKDFKNKVHSMLQPIHEKFCNRELLPTYIYGIRSYLKGSSLVMHKDRLTTHHISSILIVDKDLGGAPDWPLQILDHNGNPHDIYAQPGDLILYESAICSHGRPTTYQGNWFRNMFVHYKFKNLIIR